MSSPQPPDREDQLRELGRGWLNEVTELRKVDVPEPGDGPVKVYQVLLEVRGSLDRVEEILSLAMSVKAAAAARARDLTEVADDALDHALSDRAKRAYEYQAAKERLADANLDTIDLRIAARSAQKTADQAGIFEARIRLAYRGLDALRSDLLAALRHVSWESSLDR